MHRLVAATTAGNNSNLARNRRLNTGDKVRIKVHSHLVTMDQCHTLQRFFHNIGGIVD